jgi:hypothetical protein
MDGVALVPTVFIVQASRRMSDFEPAAEFGRLAVILDKDDQVVTNSAPTAAKIARAMQNFSEHDYLVLVGDPVAIGIAFKIACDRTGGRFHTLKWDRMIDGNRGGYWDVPIDLSKKG